MGNNKSSNQKQSVITESDLKIQGKYISGLLEHLVDKDVTNLTKDERVLLSKYAENRRTIEDLLFKDELQLKIITVNKVLAAKKLVQYFRFLDTAARPISECKGQFEQIPESAQTSAVNLAFASDYLDLKEIREFGAKIKEYFKFSPLFSQQMASEQMVDKELKNHCKSVKESRVSPKVLAEYYISFMNRMGTQADPIVVEKLQKNQYSD